MPRPVISVHNLSKEYVIGARAKQSATFAETVTSAVAAPFRRLRHFNGNVDPEERIWALKDVSFEVAEGDVVGIIGRNGAGKSTLLKVLSRITPPTDGRVEIRGRVASLLEVGTGFHPELTGRENIYLNGAILGMSRAEITRKFEEIVDFAGVDQFIDTPVKRYSSGMYLRLAFSVAAHLEPEILIVDEVLAVGDADFQKKCLGKMRQVSGEGRTVLFVSHNLTAVRSLCTHGVVLSRGGCEYDGEIDAAMAVYLDAAVRPRPTNLGAMALATRLLECAKPTIAGVNPIGYVRTDKMDRFTLEVIIAVAGPHQANIDVRIKDRLLAPVAFASVGHFEKIRPVLLSPGLNHVLLHLATDRLAVGSYFVSVDLTDPFVRFYDRAEDCLSFDVDGWGAVPHPLQQSWGFGAVSLPLIFETLNGRLTEFGREGTRVDPGCQPQMRIRSLMPWNLARRGWRWLRRPVDPDGFLRKTKGVIHVGANLGQERDVYARFDLSVLWIEPIPHIFDRLQAAIRGFSRQRAVRSLVADRDGDVKTLHIANNDGASSSIFALDQHKDIWPNIDYVSDLELETVTLSSLLRRNGIDIQAYDALVMDTQGSELLILKGATQLLSRFRFIKSEAADFSVYSGCVQRAELTRFLEQFGFREVRATRFAQHPAGGHCYDILYRKRRWALRGMRWREPVSNY